MKYVNFLIKPASSACQLKCRYCFYHDVSEQRAVPSFGNMKEDTMQALITQACLTCDEDGEITFAFQGGEPTLATLPYFQAFCAYAKQTKKPLQTIHYAIQTNAYVIDDAWASFLAEEQFLVGISLDGYRENHDYFRLSEKHTATYKQVMYAISLLRKYNVQFNILTVLSKQLAKHPKKLYDFYKHQKFAYVQLIPCLAGLQEEDNPFALTPELFARFYKEFYTYWLNDYQQGDYMSVTLFDNLIPMFADIPPQQCGLLGFCSLQFVVEGDGSIYPCDFYVLDEYKGGNIKENSLLEIAQSTPMQDFLHEQKNMSPLCATCPFANICHGNCKRMNSLYFTDSYCGYQDFLTFAHASMKQIAYQLYARR